MRRVVVGWCWFKAGLSSRELGTGNDYSRATSCNQTNVLHEARSSDGTMMEVSFYKKTNKYQ